MPEEKNQTPFTPEDLEAMNEAMNELTEADVVEVLTRMYAAALADRRGAEKLRPLTELSLDELHEALAHQQAGQSALIQFIAENPPIDWHEGRFGPVPIKQEGRRYTEDPDEDKNRVAAFDARIDEIKAEIARRLAAEDLKTANDTAEAAGQLLADGLITPEEHAKITGEPAGDAFKQPESLTVDFNAAALAKAAVDISQMQADAIALESEPVFVHKNAEGGE
jgi:hypothetical protein